MDEDRKVSYFFLGLGIGIAVGILFAPKSGEETRRYLKDRADDGREYVKRKGEEAREAAGQYVERGKTMVARQKDQLSAAVEAGKQAYRESVATAGSGSEGD